MKIPFVALVVFGVALGLLVVARILVSILGLGGGGGGKIYLLKDSVFTSAERSFWGVLRTLSIPGVAIIAKVRLADIFDVDRSVVGGYWRSALSRITSKHVDFLLIRESDGKTVLGIELDDSSHRRSDRIARDLFVDELFGKAGLPLLRVPVRAQYDVGELKRKIVDASKRMS